MIISSVLKNNPHHGVGYLTGHHQVMILTSGDVKG